MQKNIIETIPALICQYLTGDISEEGRTQLYAWVQENEQNKQLFDSLTNLKQIENDIRFISNIEAERPMNDMMARIQREMESHKQPSKAALLRRLMAAAAVVLLIVGATTLAYRMGVRNGNLIASVEEHSEEAITHGQTKALLVLDNGETIELGADEKKNQMLLSKYENAASVIDENKNTAYGESAPTPTLNLKVPRGGEFKITLEDGTEVWLNAESQLHYPETFDGKERKVALTGEAYFKVAKDSNRPFYVESSGQLIRVYGTEFNINSYQESDNIYTTLVNGSISLRPVNGNGGELVLSPGNQAVFDKQDASSTIRNVDTSVVTSWRNGKFVFENQTLEQIMITLSRWYDFDYDFLDLSLRTTIFMGSIPRYGEFSKVLSILEKSGGIKFTQKGKTIFINHK